MAIKKSFVDAKYKQLMSLNSESTAALDSITSTINRLDNINTRISTVVSEIEDAELALSHTKEELNNTRKHNETIMDKFRVLISD